MGKDIYDKVGLQVRAFYGGKDRGRCLQFGDSAQLQKRDVRELCDALFEWLASGDSENDDVRPRLTTVLCAQCGVEGLSGQMKEHVTHKGLAFVEYVVEEKIIYPQRQRSDE